MLHFVRIEGREHKLGLDWADVLPHDAQDALREFAQPEDVATWFSQPRQVTLPDFWIARDTIAAEELLGDDASLESMDTLCDALNRGLARQGYRLPSEDELEAACGDGLFYWGNEIPDGLPWPGKTEFRKHTQPNSFGLHFAGNPYLVEIVSGAFKLGDGGAALCGSYPWPIAWLALSRSFRQAGPSVEELLPEFVEDARIRPVRLA